MPAPSLLPLESVERRTGFKKSFIYEMLNQGAFPRPVRLGRAIRFVESEVDNWITQRIAERDSTPDTRTLLKASEIAPMLGVSVSTLEKDRKSPSPRFPVVWVGPHPRYDLAAMKVALATQPVRRQTRSS